VPGEPTPWRRFYETEPYASRLETRKGGGGERGFEGGGEMGAPFHRCWNFKKKNGEAEINERWTRA